MFTPVGALAAEGPVSADLTARRSQAERRRTHQPIRRRSHLKGREGVFWRPVNRRDLDLILQAAIRYDMTGKQKGQRNGPLGQVGLQVLALLIHKINRKTGQLDPSLDYLMAKLNRSRDAIVRALKALRDHGFLDWLRRYVPTGNDTGPKVQQTSNAYRLSLPERARRLLGWRAGNVPMPDDFAHGRAQRTAERDAYMADLHPVDRALASVDDEGLAAVLASLGHAIFQRKERESAERSESLSGFIS